MLIQMVEHVRRVFTQNLSYETKVHCFKADNTWYTETIDGFLIKGNAVPLHKWDCKLALLWYHNLYKFFIIRRNGHCHFPQFRPCLAKNTVTNPDASSGVVIDHGVRHVEVEPFGQSGLDFKKDFGLKFGLRSEDEVHVVPRRHHALGPEISKPGCRISCCASLQTVWPDLAKFHHFGKILQDIGQKWKNNQMAIWSHWKQSVLTIVGPQVN